jgi:hypothetical protein
MLDPETGKKPRKNAAKPADPYRHILPFPLVQMWLAPAMVCAEGPVFRAAACLCMAYWLSGCRPLPTDTASLATYCRMPHPNLVPIRKSVDAALAELLPMLATQYERAQSMQAIRVANAKIANRASVQSRRNGKRPVNDLPAATNSPARFQPQKAPRYAGDGRTDMAERSAAVHRDAAARLATHGLLTEARPPRS